MMDLSILIATPYKGIGLPLWELKQKQASLQLESCQRQGIGTAARQTLQRLAVCVALHLVTTLSSGSMHADKIHVPLAGNTVMCL